MPGNEIADEVHNFFEQDKTPPSLPSEIGNESWPDFNSSLRAQNQSQSEMPLNVNSKNSTAQSRDSERGNIRLSSQLPFGANFTQTNLSPDLGNNQPRNRQLGSKGFIHGSQGTQTRPSQTEFLEDNSFSDRHNSMYRGLAAFNPQQGNASQHSSVLIRNSEIPEVAQDPVNFGFPGNQQQLIRSGILGTLQSRLRQHPGFNNMQLWEQQLMYKQLQELQRLQQLQQLDQGARQLNPLSQLPATTKPAAINQFPALVNEIPVNDASNYVWSNSFVGGESKTPSNPQMFVGGNVNWTQPGGSPAMQNLTNGMMFPNGQGQAMRVMGIVPQQLDQSLQGMPVSNSRDSMNQYSQFQGIPSDNVDMTTKAGGNQAEKAPLHSGPLRSFQSGQGFPEQTGLQDNTSISTQRFQGKSLLENASVQSISSSVASGNFQQASHLQRSVQLQNFQDMQEQADLSGNLHEKPEAQIRPSNDVASLDPTEQKLLFGTDDGDNWGLSFGRSVNSCTGDYLHGNSLDNDYVGAFPSIQSGSWSALMQEAVQVSSSDTGLQEEWSGLSFHKTEHSIGNHSTVSNDNGKQQATWDDNNLQRAPSLTSRPLPFLNNADASTSHSTASAFHHSFTSAEASHESFRQSNRETQNKQSLHNQNQKQFLEGGLRAQMHTNNGVASGQTVGKLENNLSYSSVESKSHNMHGVWTHQLSMPLPNATSQSSNKPNGWNIKHSLGNDEINYGQRDNTNRITNIEGNYDGSMWKFGGNQVTSTGRPVPLKSDIGSPQMRSDTSCMGKVTAVMNSSTLKVNQEMNPHLVDKHQIDRGKHVAFDSFVNSASDENVEGYLYNKNGGPQAWESTINDAEKELAETYDSKHGHPKLVSNEEYMSKHSNLGQHGSDGGAARESSLLTENDPRALVGGSLKSFGQSGQQTLGSHVLQYNQMGSMGMNVQPSMLPLQTSYSQGLPQSMIQGSNQEQRYIVHSQFAGPVVSKNVIGMAKKEVMTLPHLQGNLTNLQRNARRAEDMLSRGIVPSHDSPGSSSFDGSTAQNSQNKGLGQTSQDMLELLHKVDQSRDGQSTATSDRPEGAASDVSASRPQVIQSASSQGFGLRLGPPSQRQPVSNQPSQTSLHEFSSKQLDHDSGNKDRTWLASTSSVRPLPHETSQIEHWDIRCSVPGQTCRETSQSYHQVNSSAADASDLSHIEIHLQHQQQQQQHMSRASGNQTVEQSANFSLGTQANVNSFVKNAPLLRQPHESHDGVIAFQTSAPNLAGRIPPFVLGSSADTRAPAASPFYSAHTDHSQPMDAGFSRTRSSGQQLPLVESGSGSQPSTSGMPQQVGFSKMLHNVWTNISARHLAPGQLHKLTPAIVQSMILSSNNRSADLWGLQKVDDQKQKRENASSESGACSVKSQEATYGEECPVADGSSQQVPSERVDVAAKTGIASQGQEPMRKHMLEGSPAVSISSLVCLHQQDASKGKHGQDSARNSQMVHAPLTNAASSSGDVGLYGSTSKPSDVQQQNYSLLHQMQVMKGADSDPSKRVGKRLKGADFGSDASQMDWKAGQGLVYGQNTVFRVPSDGELGATSHSSFPSDAKMLSFASRDNEERSAGTCSQLPGREASSQDIHIVGGHDLQTHVRTLPTCSASDLAGGSERPQISPQMAPSWFEQCGTYKNGQILAMYDGQRTIRPATQQFYFPKVSGSMDGGTIVAQRMDTNQVGGLGQRTLSTAISAIESSLSCMPSDVMDHGMVPRSKKRKSATSGLLPWHKEVTHGSRRLQTISMAELEWAQASNRLTEKVEDEAEMLEDGLSVLQPRRRLILTTQLVQQLLPAIPAAILKAEAASAYESVTCCVAKSALADACSLIDCSGSDSCMQLDKNNMASEKLMTPKKVGDTIYSKAVEDFIGRSKKMENEFLRLDRRTSMLDVRLECQELERFSIVNRLGKFHGRNHTDGVESSSTSENALRRTFPQRYVTALPMPGNLPEGVLCLSL